MTTFQAYALAQYTIRGRHRPLLIGDAVRNRNFEKSESWLHQLENLQPKEVDGS